MAQIKKPPNSKGAKGAHHFTPRQADEDVVIKKIQIF